MDDTFNEDTEAGKRNRKKKTIKDIRRRMADAYKRNKRAAKILRLQNSDEWSGLENFEKQDQQNFFKNYPGH